MRHNIRRAVIIADKRTNYEEIEKEFKEYKENLIKDLNKLDLYEDNIKMKKEIKNLTEAINDYEDLISDIYGDRYKVKTEEIYDNIIQFRIMQNSRDTVSISNWIQHLLYYTDDYNIINKEHNISYVRVYDEGENKWEEWNFNEIENIKTKYDIIDYLNEKTFDDSHNYFINQFNIILQKGD